MPDKVQQSDAVPKDISGVGRRAEGAERYEVRLQVSKELGEDELARIKADAAGGPSSHGGFLKEELESMYKPNMEIYNFLDDGRHYLMIKSRPDPGGDAALSIRILKEFRYAVEVANDALKEMRLLLRSEIGAIDDDISYRMAELERTIRK